MTAEVVTRFAAVPLRRNGQSVRVAVLRPSREPPARGLLHEAGELVDGALRRLRS